jgi:5'(3')-deoxyribonucleotidase
MDGVLVNFIQGLIDSHNWSITHDDYTSWNHYQKFGMTESDMWEPTLAPGWWERLAPYPWAFALVSELSEIGDIIYCSAPSHDSRCPMEKINWLRANKLMAPHRCSYQFGPRKDLNAKSGAILIDDAEHNCDGYLQAGGHPIIFPQPWNSNASHTTDRVKYTLDMVEFIQEVRNNHTRSLP